MFGKKIRLFVSSSCTQYFQKKIEDFLKILLVFTCLSGFLTLRAGEKEELVQARQSLYDLYCLAKAS